MPFIKRHIRRRLTNAKETCDKELAKVIHSITTYVEERLREPSEPDYELDLHDLGDPFVLNPGGLGGDDTDDDVNDTEFEVRRSRQGKSLYAFIICIFILSLYSVGLI